MRKSYNLQIRLSPHEVSAFARAAAKQALPMAAWIRWVALKAASEVLGQPVEQLVPREPPKGARPVSSKPKRSRA